MSEYTEVERPFLQQLAAKIVTASWFTSCATGITATTRAPSGTRWTK